MPGRPNLGHPFLCHRAPVGARCTAPESRLFGNLHPRGIWLSGQLSKTPYSWVYLRLPEDIDEPL